MTTLLHYRGWEGRFRGAAWSVWPIARVALAGLLRRRLFWVLYAFALMFFMMFFFGTYLLGWVESQMPPNPITVGRMTVQPQTVMRMIHNGLRVLSGTQETFAVFFNFQGTMVMIVLALAGSIVVGQDIHQGSLPFYLSKPIGRWHYLGGKLLATAVVVHLVTTAPALLLFSQHASGDWEYLVNPDFFREQGIRGPAGVPLLLGIVGYGMTLSIFLSIVLVALAITLKRTMPMIMAWTSLFLFLRLLASRLVEGLQYDPRWRLLDLWNSLTLVGRAWLGYDRPNPASQPELGEAAGVLLGVSIACLIYLNLRTRAVEIIR